jgi:hypothetical protein
MCSIGRGRFHGLARQVGVVVTLLGTTVALEAQEPKPSQQEELARRATDPTASPPNFSFINALSLSYQDRVDGRPVDGTGYDLRFQPVIPFKAWGAANILRMTLPYTLSGPGESGLGDVTLFDLIILPQSWGRLGVGVVANIASKASDAAAKVSFGPAIGLVARASAKLNLGVFNQNLFGTGVAVSQIQPIAAYQLGQGWSLSLGDLQWPYDWKRGELLALPVGIQLGRVLPIAGQPMRLAVNPQYDLLPQPGAEVFSVLVTVTLLLPEGK